MRLPSFQVDSPNTNNQIKINSDCAGLMFTCTFNGRYVSGDVILATADKSVFADFLNAVNGKITLTYTAPGSKGIDLVSNRSLVDVAEIYSAVGSKCLTIDWISDSLDSTYSTFVASFCVRLSHYGNIALTNSIMQLEYDGFTDSKVLGGTQNSALNIDLDTVVSSKYSKYLLQLTTSSVVAGTPSSFTVGYNHAILVPSGLSKLSVTGNGAAIREIRDINMLSYAKQNSSPHILVNGVYAYFMNWLCVPVQGFQAGQVELTIGSAYYSFSNVTIN